MTSTPLTRPRPRFTSPTIPSSPATIKSILRPNPTPLLGTRKRGHDEVDEMESPSKRKKTVHFDMSLNMTAEIGKRSLDATKTEVRKALEGHARGQNEDYNDLKDVFANDRQRYLAPIAGDEEDTLRPEELVVYVVALTTCAPLLNKSCSALIKTILQCSWVGRDELFLKAYVQFLAALVSAQGSCMEPVLTMIVDKFKEFRPSTWTVPDFPEVDRETMRERLHAGLRYLLQLFPSARPLLCKLISQRFPYSEESKQIHMSYVDNMLQVRQYAPDLGPEIMEIITNRLVKLDVDMQLDLDDMDDDLVTRVVVQLNSQSDIYDEDEDDSDLESLLSDDPDFDAEANRIEKATHQVQKLDSILDSLFTLYTPIFNNPDSPEARSCLEDMLSEFTNFVLPTYKSRHTQFLIFHFSQRSPALTDTFVGTLFNIAFESNRPTAIRQAAAAYLGSFVARGAHVSRDIVRSIANVLCHRIEMFRTTNQESCRGPDLRRYQQLYAWVQALIYIFCFRWRDLVDSVPELVDPEDPSSYLGHDLEWIPGLRESLNRIIYSPFNPMKVCTPSIVYQFAKLAHHLHLHYIYPLLETNKRVHLSQYVRNAYENGGALRDSGYDPHDDNFLQLESHFPFDPYQLPVSKRWLEGDYISWKPIPGLDRDEDSDSDEESDEGDYEQEGEFEEEDTATDDGHEDD
ncbi:uncharacterized protein E0L32_009601 [Thyridium curvatum]|uniref:RNA polymerase I-specific transcription initiation factor rrn3 n=1 Tax=Thyridium curvatum TaxID=1093900 RepID=A0A507ANI4_9PEZI|nr:uncharacterized protein E0L32_009601 [Thyridium curvatum]TPX08897.1 hypothetical protein E0L32_009601 [Thyridium curvatum]